MIKGMLGKWDDIINSWQNETQGLYNSRKYKMLF